MTGAELFVGIDLGTSGLKAVALDAAGGVVASAAVSYSTRRPEEGAAEQAPGDWMAALERALGEVGAARPGSVAGLALGAMIPTLVVLDPRGETIGPAITWQDCRAEGFAARLSERIGADRLYRLTGQRLDGRYLLPMFMRLAAADPSELEDAVVCGAKDFLFAQLTGELVTDPSTATGFGCFDIGSCDWLEEATEATAALCGLDPRLPKVSPSTTVAPLTTNAARRLGLVAGTPVLLGAADSVLAARAVGARRPGDMAYIAGTSTVIVAIADRPVLDSERRYIVTPLADEGLFGLETDLVATGSAFEWLADLLLGEPSAPALLDLAAGVDPASAPVFLPFVGGGEQGSLWDSSLRGAAAGLELRHGRAALARGLIDGVLRESRRCVELLSAASGATGWLRTGGGGCSDQRFLRDLADATGRQVAQPPAGAASASALGAAALLLEALGPESNDRKVGEGDRHPVLVAPDARRSALFDEVFGRYDAVLGALRSAFSGAP
jgi:sugar (pentulose or hexulose) kinase